VFVCEITELAFEDFKIRFSITPLSNCDPLSNDQLWRLSDELDIADFEFNRNHWAIKERELFAILANAGFEAPADAVGRFSNKSLPGPQRSELLRARDVISSWTHTKIDDLLLEIGVEAIEADRQIGSIRDRANLIVKYALEHPSTVTADNSLLTAFLARRTAVVTSAFSSASVAIPQPPRPEPLAHVGPQQPRSASRAGNRVFVVHGQNEAMRCEVVRFLQSLGLEAIVLHEQPNMGRHLLTKFIQEAELVTFAVVLMTDDDEGAIKGGKLAPRARQNVILELGYFLAHLKQPRICALITPGLETPSDFDGIVYISMSADGRWKIELKRELEAAELPIAT
jgi:hypothetical protein